MRYHITVCIIVGLLSVQNATAQSASLIETHAAGLNAAYATYHQVFTRYEQGQKAVDDRVAVRNRFTELNSRLENANEEEYGAIVAELRRLRDDEQGLTAVIEPAPDSSSLILAVRVTCFDAEPHITALHPMFSGAPPIAPNPELLSALQKARAALEPFRAGSLCGASTAERANQASERFERAQSNATAREVHMQYLNGLVGFFAFGAEVSAAQTDIDNIVDESATAIINLAEAAGSSFEGLSNAAVNMQLFRQPKSVFESAPDLTKLLGGAAAISAGVYGRSREAWWIDLVALAGGAAFLLGDLFKTTKVPRPLERVAGAVAGNRVLGLALQDMDASIEEARRLALEGRVARLRREAELPRPAPPDVNAPFSEFLVVVNEQRTYLEQNQNQSLPTVRWQQVASAGDTFLSQFESLVHDAATRRANVLARVSAAREEVLVYRMYTLSLRTAAQRLRDLLGREGDSYCENKTVAFCGLTPRGEGWMLGGTAQQVDTSYVRRLAAVGNDLLNASNSADEKIAASISSLDKIRQDVERSYERFVARATEVRQPMRNYLRSLEYVTAR